jgi:hypothetical protein
MDFEYIAKQMCEILLAQPCIIVYLLSLASRENAQNRKKKPRFGPILSTF